MFNKIEPIPFFKFFFLNRKNRGGDLKVRKPKQ